MPQTFYIKCFTHDDMLTAEIGQGDSTSLIEMASSIGEYTICTVDIELSKLTKTELNILTSQKCVMDIFISVGRKPHYIIFEQQVGC